VVKQNKKEMKKKERYFSCVLTSKLCKIIFILSLIVSFFLVPIELFKTDYAVIVVLFMIFFSLTVTCIFRNIREEIVVLRNTHHHLLGIVAAVLGISAMQVCGIATHMCVGGVGLGIISALYPVVFVNLLTKYAVSVIVGSIVLQGIALHFMGCFRRVG